MITEEQIRKLIEPKLAETDYFVVDISIHQGNRIVVEMDGPNGFPISECVNFSRQIEFNLDREQEDFALEVTSPGLTKPFKVFQQYTKNIGRKVKVKTLNGEKHKGVLKEANESEVVLESREKKKIEGKKKKEEVIELTHLPLSEIKEIKLELIF